MRKLVSVVIPTHNRSDLLGQTIESVLNQTYPNLELIVIDDGSTDNTFQVVEAYASRDKRIRFYSQPNQGPVATRNRGLALARGPYIALLDSDDLWVPEMLAASVEILDAKPDIGVVHVNWLPINESGEIMKNRSGWQPWRGDIFDRLLLHPQFNFSCLVARKVCYEEIGGFDQAPGGNDDWINWLRMAKRGHAFEAIERPLVFRRIHDGGITRQQADRIIQGHLRCLDTIFDEVKVGPSLKNAAYGAANLGGAKALLAVGNTRRSMEYMAAAVNCTPDIITREDTLFAIAYGGKLPVTFEDFDVEARTQFVEQYLKFMFMCPLLAVEHRDMKTVKRVRSKAYFCLAKIAYNTAPEQSNLARKYLWRSLQLRPTGTFQLRNWPTYARCLIGRKAIQARQDNLSASSQNATPLGS